MGIFRNSDVALELFLVKEDDCACADLIDEVFDEVDLVSNDGVANLLLENRKTRKQITGNHKTRCF